MPEIIPTKIADLAKGMYTKSGPDAEVWKVTHETEREDGRWLGLTNAAGAQKRVSVSLHGETEVLVVHYGLTIDQAADQLASSMGAVKVAEKQGDMWVHPSLHELYGDEEARILRAHLVRFHELNEAGGQRHSRDELLDLHERDHRHGLYDHTHETGV